MRVLTWEDNRLEALKVQNYVTSDYKDSARQLSHGDFKGFVSDINQLGHPPGYPIFLAAVHKLFGDSNTAIQIIQIIIDSGAPVLLFLLAFELVPASIAIIAGFLAALSPQFAYFSVLLLPDALVVVPILLAFYVLLLARRKKRLRYFAVAGALIGLSCWLRANALLLAPFLALFGPLFSERGKRMRAAATLILGTVLLVAPITIKNAIVYRQFVPLSLGAGQTLLEGLADYDANGALNIPNTDLGLMRQEAEWYQKPEYAQWLFGDDGIKRERMRLARGFSVIRAHPFWFTGVIFRRAIASMRLDPVPTLSPETPVSQDFDNLDQKTPMWTQSPQELLQKGLAVPDAGVALLNDQWLRIDGDNTRYGNQIVSQVIEVRPYHDYVLRMPLKLETGRISIKLTSAGQTKVLASTGIDLVEGTLAEQQPERTITLPFVTSNYSNVQIVVANNAASNPKLLIGRNELFELGSSSKTWLRYIRIPLGILQRIFVTAVMIPLAVIGLLLLARERKFINIGLMLAVPAYYLSVQSMLHTERRYVYVIHFFFLIFVSMTIWRIASVAIGTVHAIKNQKR